ncbi:hypothetical protein D3C84_773930 [compost metagenome]
MLEQGYAAVTAFAAQRASGHLPQLLDESAVTLDQGRTLAGQARAHIAHLAPAHGIGLAGQGKRPAAGPANRPGGQVQVAQGVGLPGAMDALVQAHGPAAHPFRRLADPCGGLADVGFGEPGDGGDPLGRVVLEKVRQGFPAFGVTLDEIMVTVTIVLEQIEQTIEQRQVGARPDLQEQVGFVGGGTAPRVDDDQPGTGLEPVEQA